MKLYLLVLLYQPDNIAKVIINTKTDDFVSDSKRGSKVIIDSSDIIHITPTPTSSPTSTSPPLRCIAPPLPSLPSPYQQSSSPTLSPKSSSLSTCPPPPYSSPIEGILPISSSLATSPPQHLLPPSSQTLSAKSLNVTIDNRNVESRFDSFVKFVTGILKSIWSAIACVGKGIYSFSVSLIKLLTCKRDDTNNGYDDYSTNSSPLFRCNKSNNDNDDLTNESFVKKVGLILFSLLFFPFIILFYCIIGLYHICSNDNYQCDIECNEYNWIEVICECLCQSVITIIKYSCSCITKLCCMMVYCVICICNCVCCKNCNITNNQYNEYTIYRGRLI